MGAPGQSKSIPIIDANTLQKYDAFLFGIPTRFGNFPAQWKAFWDTTGMQWSTGGYWGKYAGVFVSTATPGGGQETTVISTMSTLAHHGMIYVPLGYKTAFPLLSELGEIRGGSPWGAGTFSVSWDTSIYIRSALLTNFRRDSMGRVCHPKRKSSSLPSKESRLVPLLPRLTSPDEINPTTGPLYFLGDVMRDVIRSCLVFYIAKYRQIMSR